MQNKELANNFPEQLRLLPQWVLWRKELAKNKDGEDKWTKVPYQINGKKAAVTRPDEWVTFAEAMAHADDYDGVGFVFTDGYIGIDLDNCFLPDGSLNEIAQETLGEFDSYTEKSPSGKGLHIIIESDVPIKGRKNDNLGIECYSTNRFFTVTGDVFEYRDTIYDCDINAWYANNFKEKIQNESADYPSGGYLPHDQSILSIIFHGMDGDMYRTLYNATDGWKKFFNRYPSQSQADQALCNKLMFFCRNDIATADRLFRGSKLMRDKWDERRGSVTYGQMTLQEARRNEVMNWTEPGKVMPSGKICVDFLMSADKDPKIMLILENVVRVFKVNPEIRDKFRLNDFSHMIEVFCEGNWKNMQDLDVLDVVRWISVHYPVLARASKEMVTDAIKCIAALNKVNPPVDYLRGLIWDKTPRLDSWLHTVYGTPNDEIHKKIGANWMKGLVKRVLHPGCQFDEVLVLEGEQGWRKSTSLRVLGAPWHVESTLSTDDRDFYMLLAQNMIVEFSEGDIVGRTSARKLKAIITKVEDSYRPPYERGLLTFKRGCVFAMTTNDSDYQKDETGGRRWLPVVLGKIADIDWLTDNRDQLYAEAVYRIEVLNETVYEYPTKELQALQSEKFEYDEITEAIVEWYYGLPLSTKERGVLTIDAYNAALNPNKGFEGDRMELPRSLTWRIAKVFRVTLGLVNKSKRVDKIVIKRWFKK